MHVSPRVRAILVACLAGTALLIVGCVEVERTVTDRDFLPDEHGIITRSVVWESNRYPDQQIHAEDACWDASVIGAPVPDVCLSSRVILSEADPYKQLTWLAFIGSVIAIGGFFWFALRRVAWQPFVARHTSERGASAFSSAGAVSLMRGVEEEKLAQGVATGRRKDVQRPALVGAALAAAAVLPLVVLFGYGAALAWAIKTGTIIGYGLAAGVIVILVPLPPRPADPDAFISRLLFFGGVTVVLLVVAFLAAVLFRTPMLVLNGIAWFG